LNISSSAGDINVSASNGELNLTSQNANTNILAQSGDINLTTQSGDINLVCGNDIITSDKPIEQAVPATLETHTIRKKELDIVVSLIDEVVTVNMPTVTSYVVDAFNISDYKSVKYLIEVIRNTDVSFIEMLMCTNGINVYMSEYGVIGTSKTMIDFSANVAGGVVTLSAVPEHGSTVVKIKKSKIKG